MLSVLLVQKAVQPGFAGFEAKSSLQQKGWLCKKT